MIPANCGNSNLATASTATAIVIADMIGVGVFYASRLQHVLKPHLTRTLRKAGVAAFVASAIILAPAYSARAQTASADDTARFLAGMPPSSDSPLAPLTQDPAWQQHARYFNSAFGNLDRNQFAKIRAWSRAKQIGRAHV